MSTVSKEWIVKWFPLIVCLLGNALSVGYVYGINKAEHERFRDADAENRAEIMPMPQRVSMFVTRVEFDALSQRLIQIDSKLDRLLEKARGD